MFVPEDDGVVVATMLTQGPWDPNSQYGGTPAALLTWAVERVPTLVPMRIARITVDMHRRVPLGRLEVAPRSCARASACRSWSPPSTIPDGHRGGACTALAVPTRDRSGRPDGSEPAADRDATVGRAERIHEPRSNDLNGFIDATEMRERAHRVRRRVGTARPGR